MRLPVLDKAAFVSGDDDVIPITELETIDEVFNKEKLGVSYRHDMHGEFVYRSNYF